MEFNYNIWNKLKFRVSFVPANWIIHQKNTGLIYKNRRVKSIAVQAAKQLLMSEIEGNIKKVIPSAKRALENQLRQVVLKQQAAVQKELIVNQQNQSTSWGSIMTVDGHEIIAKDKYGTPVKEALMLYYNDETAHTVEDVRYLNGTVSKLTYNTKTVCHIDLAPEVSMNSTKNIVMTQVQGRDYTRKELVSGGDLQFSVNGNIVSDERGVYPVDAVKKFIQIMEYNGILNVKYMMLGTLNVYQVIIKDYSLGQQTYKNIQPYSFSCVAIEPDDEVKVQSDTISVINKTITASPMDKWYSLILNSKLAILAEQGTESVNTAIVSATAMGLDALTTHI